jgi:hypothetical protein
VNHPDNRTRKHFFRATGVSIGEDVVVNANLLISDSYADLVTIGDRASISPNVTIIAEAAPNNSLLAEHPYVREHLIKTDAVRIEADAYVGYGQQLMAIIDTHRPLDSMVYAAVGLDIRVSFRASAWFRFKAGFVRITWRISFSFDIQISASIEFGAAGRMDLGMRARTFVSIGVFGRRLGVRISIGIRDGAVDRARRALAPYMVSILEPDATIPTIPGLTPKTRESATTARRARRRSAFRKVVAAETIEDAVTVDDFASSEAGAEKAENAHDPGPRRSGEHAWP